MKPVSLLHEMSAILFAGKPKRSLEVMNGTGQWSSALEQFDDWICKRSDILISSAMDWTNPDYVDEVCEDMVRGRIGALHIGLDCRTWSTAPHCYRNPNNLEGFDQMPSHLRQSCDEGTVLAHNSVKALKVGMDNNVCVSLENGERSFVWQWDPMREVCADERMHAAIVHYCQFGRDYQKPTRIVSNLPAISILSTTCNCGRHIERLQYASAKAAAEYPPRLCKKWAFIIAKAFDPRL